jgi:hypothetical protein
MILQRTIRGSAVIAAFALTLPNMSFGQAAQPPAPQWEVITAVKFKPEFRQEVEAIQKEISAAYKKLNLQRVVVETTLGDIDEMTSVAPLTKLGDLDGPSPLARAMGEANSQKLLKRLGGYLTSVHRMTAISLEELSVRNQAAAGEYAAIAVLHLFPGKGPDFANFTKNDYIPMLKKANVANYWVSQPVFGAESNTRVTIRPLQKIGELDAGPLTRILGQEGARQMAIKQAAIVQSVETSIVHLRLDLSNLPAMPEKPKPSAE